MPAPTITHLICTTALIMLIIVMQFSYMQIVNNVQAEVMRRKLKDIADHVSNTFLNLYYLLNSSGSTGILKKVLEVPEKVEEILYYIQINYDASSNEVESIKVFLTSDNSIYAVSWLVPRLKANTSMDLIVLSSENNIFACCGWFEEDFLIWFEIIN